MPKPQQPHGRRGEAIVERVDEAVAVVQAEAALALAWEANSFGDGRG